MKYVLYVYFDIEYKTTFTKTNNNNTAFKEKYQYNCIDLFFIILNFQ